MKLYNSIYHFFKPARRVDNAKSTDHRRAEDGTADRSPSDLWDRPTLAQSECVRCLLPDDTYLAGCNLCETDNQCRTASRPFDENGNRIAMSGPAFDIVSNVPESVSDIPISLTPLPEPGGQEIANGRHTSWRASPVREKAPDYERDRTFGSAAAPWVGAERVWRERLVPLPHEHPVPYGTRSADGEAYEPLSMELSDAELAMVISTMPPAPHRADGKGSGRGRRLVSTVELLGLTGAAAVVAVVLFYGVRSQPLPSPVEKSTTVSRHFAAPATWSDSSNISADHAIPAKSADQFSWSSASPTGRVKTAQSGRRQGVPTVSINNLAVRTPRMKTPDFSKATPIVVPSPVIESEPVVAVAALEETMSTPVGEAPIQADPIEKTVEEKVQEMHNRLEPVSNLDAILMTVKTSRPDPSAYKSDVKQPLDPETGGNETKTLSKADVERTMAGISSQVQRCSGGKHGSVLMKVVVSGSTGRVINAAPADRAYIGTPVSLCISRAMGLAKFPKFDLERQHIEHRFYLR